MSKLTMLASQLGSPDGITVQDYQEGQEYEIGTRDMSASLAYVFVSAGIATSDGASVPVTPESGATTDPAPSDTTSKPKKQNGG